MGTTGTTRTTWGGHHRDNRGDHGDHSHGDHMHGDLLGAMGTMWGQHGDNTGMTWGRRGQCGHHGDNKITKNAITFEQIKVIEFRLKIWDP